MDIIVYVDLETTGLNPLFDDIIEIGAISENRSPFQELIHTSLYNGLPQRIVDLTGISDELLEKEGHSPDQVYPRFAQWIQTLLDSLTGNTTTNATNATNTTNTHKNHLYIIGHNGDNFDHPFLRRHMSKYSQVLKDKRIRFCDSRTFIWYLEPGIQYTSLATLSKALHISYEGAHRAIQDAHLCHAILDIYIRKYPDFVDPEGHILWNRLYRTVYQFM